MKGTLIARLGRVRFFEELGREYQIPSTKTRQDIEETVLKEFFKEEPLARAVYKGTASYRTSIAVIEEHYSSFWRRATLPSKDTTYDQEARRILDSMNHVGVDYQPELFTSEGRKSEIQAFDTLFTKGLGGIAILVICGAFALRFYEEGIAPLLADPFRMGLLPGTILTLHGITRALLSDKMKEELQRLREAAQETDTFLTQLRQRQTGGA